VEYRYTVRAVDPIASTVVQFTWTFEKMTIMPEVLPVKYGCNGAQYARYSVYLLYWYKRTKTDT
jgi:hypothetical protein